MVKNSFDKLKNVKVSRQQSPQEKGEMLRAYREDYVKGIAEADVLADLMNYLTDHVEIKDAVVLENFDKIVESFAQTSENLMAIDERAQQCADGLEYAELVNQQKALLLKMENDLKEAGALIGVNPEDIRNAMQKEKDQEDQAVENQEIQGGFEISGDHGEQELKALTIEVLLQKHDEIIERAQRDYPKVQKIQNMVGRVAQHVKKNRGVINIKNAQRREKNVKELREYIITFIDQLEQEMRYADAFVTLVKEFGRTKQIFEDGNGRSIQIIAYDVRGEENQVTYAENGNEYTVGVDAFRELIKDIKEQQFKYPLEEDRAYKDVIKEIKEENAQDKDLQDLVKNIDRIVSGKRRALNQKVNKKPQERAEKIQDLRSYLIAVTGQIREAIEKSKERMQQEALGHTASGDITETVKPGSNDAEQILVEKEINEIFDSPEIAAYIGTGTGKKVLERRTRIEQYKKTIAQGIDDFERSSGERIDDRLQYVFDYVKKKGAINVERALMDHITNQKHADIQKTRDAAEITLNRVKSYDKLHAETVEKGDERFKEITREVWNAFAVRGYLHVDKETQTVEVHKKTNPDCKVALWLLTQAGLDIKDLVYIAPGDIRQGRINIDTGNVDGISVSEDGTVVIDHHGENVSGDTSAAAKVYDSLVRLGLLERSVAMDRLVAFIDAVDNFDYPNKEQYFKNFFKNSWNTMLGVYRMMTVDEMMAFFRYGEGKGQKELSPTDVLSPTLQKRFHVGEKQMRGKNEYEKTRVEKQRESVKRQEIILQHMQRDGMIVESTRYGKICIDLCNCDGAARINNDAARASGCDTYIIWNKTQNGFFISSLVGKAIEDRFAQGKHQRSTMCIKPVSMQEPLMQLRDLLMTMTDGTLAPSAKLEEVLQNNGEHISSSIERVIGEDMEKVLSGYREKSFEHMGHVEKFYRKIHDEADWTGVSPEDKKAMLKQLTMTFIKNVMEKADPKYAASLEESDYERMHEYFVEKY